MRRFTRLAKSGRCPRVVYGTPTAIPKNHGSVDVGVGSEATGPTVKPILGLTVGLRGVAADRTLAAAIARIDGNQKDGGLKAAALSLRMAKASGFPRERTL